MNQYDKLSLSALEDLLEEELSREERARVLEALERRGYRTTALSSPAPAPSSDVQRDDQRAEVERESAGCLASLAAIYLPKAMLLMSLLGIGGVFVGVEELRLASIAGSEPAPLSLGALGENGPGDNAHLLVSDFLLDQNYVVSFSGSAPNRSWDEVWIPAVPLGGDHHLAHVAFYDAMVEQYGDDWPEEWPEGVVPPKLEHFDVIFKVTRSPSRFTVDRIAESETLRGLVINEIERINGETRELLEAEYPVVDFDHVYIFEVERSPKSAAEAFTTLGIGIGLLGLSALLLFRRRFGRSSDGSEFDQGPPQQRSGAVN